MERCDTHAYKIENGIATCVSKCDGNYISSTEDVSKKMCIQGKCSGEQYFIAEDGNENVGECVDTCNSKEANKVDEVEKRCYTECPSHYTAISNGVLTCVDNCLSTQRVISNGTSADG